MGSRIRQIEYVLPASVLDNRTLADQFPEWTVEKISAKTGISRRHIAEKSETAGDLAVAAAAKLFAAGSVAPEDIDFVLLCTQSPDYFLPTTACIVQHRLGVPTTAGALDFNLGCSGYVYGLSLAKGLVETGQAENVLLLTAETYSKFIDDDDRSVRTIFGDGAAATLISGGAADDEQIGPFVFGTDGAGAENLIVANGGMRSPVGEPRLYMNGPDIFAFSLDVVPKAVSEVLARAGSSVDAVDRVVLHQANAYMLEHLRRRIGIDSERFVISLDEHGNTVSSTIPIALREAAGAGMLTRGQSVLLVGFGVGYSWAAAMIRWSA